MFNKYTASITFALTIVAAPLSAASIDLAALGLEKGATVATASGGVFFDDAFPILTSDDPFDPLLLDGFSGAIQFAFEGDTFLDTVLIDFDDPDGFSTNQREFEISASGDDESSILEFLLDEFSPSAGRQALLSISFDPSDVDFSILSPFDFFSDRANDPFAPQDAYSVSVELEELNSIASIPLPAGFLLMGTALAGLGFAARRRKTA
ncbi:MAG: VPLPA-CTERM sorting domain-containing protein [Paracoccaceae bacterium]